MDRPDVYQQAAHELWYFGETKIGNLYISPRESCKKPSGDFYKIDKNHKKPNINSPLVSGLDWVTLASLRDITNNISSYSEVSDRIAGISYAFELRNWFYQAGYQVIRDQKYINYTSHSSIADIKALNRYVQKEDYWVVSLISDDLLGVAETQGKGRRHIPTHWIVWMGPIKIDNSHHVNLNLFTWGTVSNYYIRPNTTIEDFSKHFFGSLVFKRIR